MHDSNIDQLKEILIENERLTQELDQYKVAAEGAKDGLWDWDIANNRLFISQQGMSMLGHEDTDTNIFEAWEDLLHPGDKEVALKEFARCLAEESEYRNEFRLRHVDGSYVWIYAKASIFRDENGQAIRVAGSHTDVTDRHFVEDQLKQNEHLVKNIADAIPDLVYVYDLVDEKYVFMNIKEEYLGYNKEVVMSAGQQLFAEKIHADDMEAAYFGFVNIIDSLKDGEIFESQFRLKNVNDEWRWINSRRVIFHRDENGKVLQFLGLMRDITTQKKNEKALIANETKFRNLFENSQVGMFRSDVATGKILEANPKFWQIVGTSISENPTTYDFYVTPDDRNKVISGLETHGYIENVEIQIYTIDREKIWVTFSSVLYEEEGFIETVIRDTTSTRNNIEELEKVNFELDSFVYHASHDLRSPLRSILGLVDVYRKESENPDIREICVTRIEESAKRLDLLVTDLLSISRNNRVNDPYVPFNLLSEIRQSVESYGSEKKCPEIIFDIRQPVELITDGTRLRIILNNVISNAVKYADFSKENPFVKIEAKVDEHMANIRISDNGEGIPAEKIDHIFDMFVRATERSEGSGLGLYIVKNVAEKMNAKIDLYSEELEGTVFTIEVPNSKRA